ncbi:MAG: heparinase II/III family protein [Clostridiales bacterium]
MTKYRKRLIILLIFIVFIVGYKNIFAENTKKNIYPKKNSHPQVLVSSDEIADLKNKYNSKEFEKTKNELLKNSTLYLHGENDYDFLKSIEANAFLYLINKDKNNGLKSYELLKKALKNEAYFNNSHMASRLTFSLALVYDWCYNLLSSKQRVTLISQFKKLTKYTELSYPIHYDSTLTSHSSGDLLLKNYLAASIAVYDEDKSFYNEAIKDINKKFIPSRKFIYNSNTHHQGTNYGSARFESELMSYVLLDKIGYKLPYGKNQLEIPLSWIYHLRGDNKFLSEGDTFDGKYISRLDYIIASKFTNNPYLANMASKFDFYYIDEPILYLIFYDPKIKKSTFESLPLTKYFSSPIGKMIARTGWDEGKNSNSVVVEMKIGEYNFANHSHLDSGSFQIYYKGALAIDSGVYEGDTGGYNSEHYKNYYRRTIAHNSILVTDPDEKFIYQDEQLENDGGQKIPNNGEEAYDLSDLKKNDYKTGSVQDSWYGPSKKEPVFSYLKGNISNAYSSKIENLTRTFIFINHKNNDIPASLIIYDNLVSSQTKMKKTWLLHSIEKPQYSDNNVIISRKEDGYSGKLTNTILMPENEIASVNIIGGSGKEFLVNGKNYPNKSYVSDIDSGNYRTELFYSKNKKSNQFLNVMQISDESKEVLYPIKKSFVSNNLLKINIDNKSVLFSKNNRKTNSSFTFKNTNNSKTDFLISDLNNGTWKVYGDNKLIKTKKLKDTSSVLSFDTNSKNIKIEKYKKLNTFEKFLEFLENLKSKFF